VAGHATVINPDQVGFDEDWIGEHHSGGIETIGSPEMFMRLRPGAPSEKPRHRSGDVALPPIRFGQPMQRSARLHDPRAKMVEWPRGQIVKDAQMMGLDPEQTAGAFRSDRRHNSPLQGRDGQ